MPYEGKQAQACWSKASACLSAGLQPDWECDDWFTSVWDLSEKPKTKITSGKYVDTCGSPLKAGEPTTTYQARKQAQSLGLKHDGTDQVYHVKIAPKS